MTWPIAPSIEYNQASWKEIRPILSSLNIYPIDGGSEMTWNIWSEIHHIFQLMLLVLNYGAGKALSLAFENYSSVIVKKKTKWKGESEVPVSFEPFFE